MPQLDPGSLQGAGIILIRREDPINLLLSTITNQACSILGFYYISTISGCPEICLILSDFQGMISSNHQYGHRLQDWINDPLIVNILIMPLIIFSENLEYNPLESSNSSPVDKNEFHSPRDDKCFRSAIIDITKKYHQVPAKDVISSLFQGPKVKFIPIEIVNKVILKLDEIYSKSKHPTSRKGKPPELGPHLIESLLFGNIRQLRLPLHSERTIIKAWKKRLNNSKLLFRQYTALFADILFDRREYLNTFMVTLRHRLQPSALPVDFTAKMTNLINSADDFLCLIINGFDHGHISQSQLKRYIRRYIADRQKLSNYEDLNLKSIASSIPQLSVNSLCISLALPNPLIVPKHARRSNSPAHLQIGKVSNGTSFDDDPDKAENADRPTSIPGSPSGLASFHRDLRDEDTTTELLRRLSMGYKSSRGSNPKNEVVPIHNVILQLKDHIIALQTAITDKETPIFNLDILTNSVNSLIKLMKIPTTPLDNFEEKASYPGVLTTAPYEIESVPIKLKNGKRMILTTRRFDISGLSKSELEEILHSLDITTEDPAFDELKAAITRQLSNFMV